MAIEQPQEQFLEDIEVQKPISDESNVDIEKPNDLVRRAESVMRYMFRINLLGEENIAEIPKDKKVIIAATHISDQDMPLVIAALGKHFKNIAVARNEKEFDIKRDPLQKALIKFLEGGKDCNLPISYTQGNRLNSRGVFDPEDFEQMKGSLENNSPIVMAAHKFNNPGEWQLPSKAGNGVAYLSQITEDSVILPVAVDVKSDKPIGYGLDFPKIIAKKPRVDIRIGKPFEPDRDIDTEAIKTTLEKRAIGGDISSEEKKAFRASTEKLKHLSEAVMDRLADLLPEEKRGGWGTHQNISSE
ncbi:MAG: hypothetical protein Q7S53_03385 [bacterium]|nr:hypothetical protein [bacterium]